MTSTQESEETPCRWECAVSALSGFSERHGPAWNCPELDHFLPLASLHCSVRLGTLLRHSRCSNRSLFRAAFFSIHIRTHPNVCPQPGTGEVPWGWIIAGQPLSEAVVSQPLVYAGAGCRKPALLRRLFRSLPQCHVPITRPLEFADVGGVGIGAEPQTVISPSPLDPGFGVPA